MDVTKIRMQLHGELTSVRTTPYRSHVYRVWHAVRGIYIQEGLKRGLYVGFSAALLRQLSFSSMRHGFFSVLNDQYAYHLNQKMSPLQQVLGGAIIGAFCAFITNPCDIVLVRMQSDGCWPCAQRRNYAHIFDGFRRVASEEGVATLWRGSSATLTRGFLVTCSQLPSYHTAKHYFLQSGLLADNMITHVICSIFSATVASIVSCPADVIKTRMMNMRNEGKTSYRNTLDCVLKTARVEGLHGFYKGLGATILRLGPHTVLMWICQEQYLLLLREYIGVKKLD